MAFIEFMVKEGNKEMEEFVRLERNLVHKGSIIEYYVDTIQVPNGNIVHWDHIEHKGAVAIIPVTEQGNILMVRQWRNSLNRFTWEIPAGGLNHGEYENTEVAAMRELEEETGHNTDHLEFLMSIRTTDAFCNEKIDIYIARDLKETSQNLDEDEFISVKEISVDELSQMIYRGEIEDSKTISAIFAYKDRLNQR